MKSAYVDTSCFVAIALEESGAASVMRRLTTFDALYSSNLLEAELFSTLHRERVRPDALAIARIAWVVPDRPLHAEIERVLAEGYVRGADCWHLATALYLARDPGEIAFVTLDTRQWSVARKLGFQE
ncbi:MAG TPA: PIN domain-containing protein [Gemmatimonadaceae bacterium]|nr:PIN domain-containing protein [Gemmatimonadaceae bacterium]